jgi:hypothetical protein
MSGEIPEINSCIIFKNGYRDNCVGKARQFNLSCPKNSDMADMTFEELVKNHSPELIERLVRWVVNEDPVEIHFDFLGNDQWAIISMHIYEEDQEISIRLHSGDKYDLYFGYYDEEDEFYEIIHPLTEDEIKILPDGLKKLMKSVLDKEEGMRIPGNFLSRK